MERERVGRGMGIRRPAGPGKDNLPKNGNQPAGGEFRMTQTDDPDVCHTPNAPTITMDSRTENTPQAPNPKEFGAPTTAASDKETSRTTRHLPLETRARIFRLED